MTYLKLQTDMDKERLLHNAELIWFIVMICLVVGYFSWQVSIILSGKNVSYRYGLPLFSGLPKFAQNEVIEFEHDPPSNLTEVINGTLIVNMTIYQYYFKPDLIVAKPGQPVVIILNSPNATAGFYLRLPSGVINVNVVPGIPSYIYFVAPNQPGNYTWYEPEYIGWGFSYMNGTLEVV